MKDMFMKMLIQYSNAVISFSESCINKHKCWMTSYIIMCIMIVVSLPLYSYIYSCSNLTDYKEHINSGDTIIIPIHRQYLVTSLTVSLDSSCQGTLYLVPANEVTLRYCNREISYTFKDAFLYLGLNSVIHFTKAATNYTLQVWVTDSWEIAQSLDEYSCASPPKGTTCIPPLIDSNDNLAVSNHDKCTVLNDYFASVFTADDGLICSQNLCLVSLKTNP